jgi:2-oxoisovalerate dehydrogenase E1 component
MKCIDVIPHENVKNPEHYRGIPIYRYTPTLAEELEKNIITAEEALLLFRAMVMQREFERMVAELDVGRLVPFEGFEFRGTAHLSVGQEASSMGAMSVLSKNDYITSTHRGHGHCIGKGLFALYQMSEDERKRFVSTAPENGFDIDSYSDPLEAAVAYHLFRTIAELLGKEAGYCRGRGGGMHIADFSVGNLGANAIVGGSFGIATGAAFAAAHQKEDRVALCCIGDGSMNNGIAHEAMNFAAMKQFERGVPVIYYLENNQYGYTGQQKGEVTGVDVLAKRGCAYNETSMYAETVCGMNILSVREAVRKARDLCLRGEGPVLLEANTYRYYGHNFRDKGVSYRSTAEMDAWKDHDPLAWFREQLIENGLAAKSKLDKTRKDIQRSIESLTIRAAGGKDPDPKDMYFGLSSDSSSNDAGDEYRTVAVLKKPRKYPRDSDGKILARHAVTEALIEEMMRDRRVLLWGEDVAEHGGAFSATLGLYDTFGPERVFNTAISESAIVGTGIGAAMAGLRPVVEIMFIDFILQAMDQVGNQAAKARFMFGGQYNIPLTIRTTVGGGKGYAGQHSQSLESVVTHFPGLKVVMPSNAYDMKGLLKSSIRDDNPVVFIEHQWVYLEKAVVPMDEDYLVPLGVAQVVREGKDITVVAYSHMVSRSLEAADILEREDGVQVEIVDPRTLVPLDMETVAASVNKTGRAVVVTQSTYFGSYSCTLSHEISRNCFKKLRSPVRIVSSYDVPPPMAYSLERECMPSAGRIAASIRETLKA